MRAAPADLLRDVFGGMQVIETHVGTKREPSPGEWARRYVRHGMADILEWLGEDVGPEPDAPIYQTFVMPRGTVVIHPDTIRAIKIVAGA